MIRFLNKLGQSAIRPTFDSRLLARESSSRRMADWLKSSLLILFIVLSPITNIRGAQDDGVYTYVFQLYFENGSLIEDRDFENPFELIAQEFQKSNLAPNSYRGEIMSVTNKKLGDFTFSLPIGNEKRLAVLAPYFDNAKTANFYNSQNQKLLTIDLAPSGPLCNEDKLCNNETGETNLNCSSDCPALTSSMVPIPMPVGKPSFNFFDTFVFRLIITIFIIVLVLVIIWWLKRKKNVPPEIPL